MLLSFKIQKKKRRNKTGFLFAALLPSFLIWSKTQCYAPYGTSKRNQAVTPLCRYGIVNTAGVTALNGCSRQRDTPTTGAVVLKTHRHRTNEGGGGIFTAESIAVITYHKKTSAKAVEQPRHGSVGWVQKNARSFSGHAHWSGTAVTRVQLHWRISHSDT